MTLTLTVRSSLGLGGGLRWEHCDHMNDTVERNSLEVEVEVEVEVGEEAQHAPCHSGAQRDTALRSLL